MGWPWGLVGVSDTCGLRCLAGVSDTWRRLLGWPLEWTEIIVIFMPVFVPLLIAFGIDPLLFGLWLPTTLYR